MWITNSGLLIPSAVAAMTEEERLAEEAAADAAAAAVGQQAEEEEEEDGGDAMDEDADSARMHEGKFMLTDMPPPARDVSIAAKFVEGLGDDETLTLGKGVRVLVGMANGGRSTYHVWGMQGSLSLADSFGTYVQNFSYTGVNRTVPAGEELSMSYAFTPNERLDTRSFQMALSVFYEAQSPGGDALRGHSTTFYNATLATRAGPQSINNTAFLVLTALFVIACGCVIAFLLAPTAEPTKRPAGEGVETAKDDSDWLEEHSRMMQSGGGRSGPTKATRRR